MTTKPCPLVETHLLTAAGLEGGAGFVFYYYSPHEPPCGRPLSIRVTYAGSGANLPGLKSWLHHLPTIWPQANVTELPLFPHFYLPLRSSVRVNEAIHEKHLEGCLAQSKCLNALLAMIVVILLELVIILFSYCSIVIYFISSSSSSLLLLLFWFLLLACIFLPPALRMHGRCGNEGPEAQRWLVRGLRVHQITKKTTASCFP